MSDVVAMGVPLSGQVSHPLVILEGTVQFSLLKKRPGKHVGRCPTESEMSIVSGLAQRICFLQYPTPHIHAPMVE